jgi:hypothetical protein
MVESVKHPPWLACDLDAKLLEIGKLARDRIGIGPCQRRSPLPQENQMGSYSVLLLFCEFQ